MRHGLRYQAIVGAKALRSRAFVALFAIVSLFAIPLGTGDLFAASSHLFERSAIEAGHGDLPRRVGVASAGSPTDFISDQRVSVSLLALLDDTPDAIGVEHFGFTHCPYCAGSRPAPVGVLAARDAGFNARAPPLN